MSRLHVERDEHGNATHFHIEFPPHPHTFEHARSLVGPLGAKVGWIHPDDWDPEWELEPQPGQPPG
jgi:hypothetical protein